MRFGRDKIMIKHLDKLSTEKGACIQRMNIYVKIMNEVVDYIENRINDKLTLSYLAYQFGISDFHFNRMFHTVTGNTLKQYILGRKLARATQLLKETDESIIDIAYDLNFEYPEVFSRAFKKQYGISPSGYREKPGRIEGISRASIIERDIVNYGGSLALKGSCTYIKGFPLYGITVNTNVYSEGFQENLERKSSKFVLQSLEIPKMQQDFYYTAVNCDGEDTGDYTIFCGRRSAGNVTIPDFDKRMIPEGWYVSFRYQGDMFRIRETFTDELYRYIMVKEAELNHNGIGMLDIYPQDYRESNAVEILVPVKNPV